MAEYSFWSLLKGALNGQSHWQPTWRKATPKPYYDAIIVGGGHGLATVYYLAKLHGLRNIALLEKSHLGSGNIGRNTTIVRSNYLLHGNGPFYEQSMRLWRELSKDLNYNVMFSSRGVLNLAHSPEQMDKFARRGNMMRARGTKSELLNRDDVKNKLPFLDFSDTARFPIAGGLLQPDAGNARHDAVAWGYAHAADRLGVDIIEHCEVTDIIREGDSVVGVKTTLGDIKSPKVGLALAGRTSILTNHIGLNLPIESHLLQACVSESIKPFLDMVVTFGAGHFYISQSNKGGMVFGGDLDGYNSYAAQGNLPMINHVAAVGVSMLPGLSRLKLLRHWGGIMDMSMDGSPIISKTPIKGLYLNTGWCYGGFKATPASGWCFAHMIAHDEEHEYHKLMSLDRFAHGYQIDEEATGPIPGHH